MNFEKWFKPKNKDKQVSESYLEEYLAGINNNGRFRVNLLNDQEKSLIAKQLSRGYEPDLDGLRDLVGRDRAKEIHWRSVELSLEEKKRRQEARKAELIRLGRDREPLVLKEHSVNVADIHGLKDGQDNEDIIKGLPDQVPGKIINVAYEEKISSTDANDDLEGNFLKFVDASGRMSAKFLQSFFKTHEQAAFIMTGGNLRGCYLESLKGVMKEADLAQVKKLDIHVPLDKCYDDPVYDKLTGFKDLPEAISKSLTENAEIYQNGELSALAGNKDDLESRFRFYFWDKSEAMIERMQGQLAQGIDGPDAEVSLVKLVADHEQRDRAELARLRSALAKRKIEG